jgi:hypothetical protein
MDFLLASFIQNTSYFIELCVIEHTAMIPTVVALAADGPNLETCLFAALILLPLQPELSDLDLIVKEDPQ